MQSPDVNVLVNAYRQDAVHHDRCRAWLDGTISRRVAVGVSEVALGGVLRILTHPRIFDPPTSVEDGGSFVDSILAQDGFSGLRPGFGHWRIFRGLVRMYSPTGNRVPDAYHAALAIEHGSEWVTLDRGFSVYPGLRCRNLLDG